MDEEQFNIEIRKFLKKVGITSQREIERAVREAIASGGISGNETLRVRITLEVGQLDLTLPIDGEIKLG